MHEQDYRNQLGGASRLKSKGLSSRPTAPSDFAATIHTRMPAILEGEAEDTWLDPTQTDASALLPLLRPFAGELAAHPVSPLVNGAGVDEPACIEPVEPPAEDPGPEPPQQLDLF